MPQGGSTVHAGLDEGALLARGRLSADRLSSQEETSAPGQIPPTGLAQSPSSERRYAPHRTTALVSRQRGTGRLQGRRCDSPGSGGGCGILAVEFGQTQTRSAPRPVLTGVGPERFSRRSAIARRPTSGSRRSMGLAFQRPVNGRIRDGSVGPATHSCWFRLAPWLIRGRSRRSAFRRALTGPVGSRRCCG